MLRLVIATGFSLLFSVGVNAQLKKFYTIKETSDFDTVNFTLKAASGNTLVKNFADSNYPLVIYGNPDLDRVNPSFMTKFKGRTCHARLVLDEFNSKSFGDGLAFVISKKGHESAGNYWKILVDEEKVYRFNMNYGFGNTEVDLGRIKTDHVRLNTGSANVKIGYKDGEQNLVVMDTFYVKVDMGSLVTKNLGNARVNNFIADIGFGTAMLDFSGRSTDKLRCDAKIGAGSLEVIISNKNCPVIIYLKDSPFCGVRMVGDFEQVEKNVYINHSYSAKATNLMVFDIDLAMGSVSFQYSE